MSHCAKIVFLQNFGDVKMRFSKRNCIFLIFLFYVGEIETEDKKKRGKWEKAKMTYKNSVLLRWSSKNVKNPKKFFFWQKLPDTICVRKGEKTRIFVHTICFGQ